MQDAFLEKHGVKLGFMSAFVKASADALHTVPAANAVIDGDEIVYRDYVDISIAVATPKGLVVPVLRGADALSFAEVEKVCSACSGHQSAGHDLCMPAAQSLSRACSTSGTYMRLLSFALACTCSCAGTAATQDPAAGHSHHVTAPLYKNMPGIAGAGFHPLHRLSCSHSHCTTWQVQLSSCRWYLGLRLVSWFSMSFAIPNSWLACTAEYQCPGQEGTRWHHLHR